MLPHNLPAFEFIHIKSLKDLPHLAIVVFLILGIGVGVYLALQPQIFNKQASESTLVDLKFIPESLQSDTGKEYEAKIAINPKGQRVSAVQLNISYNADVISVLEVKNGGFLPVELRVNDDHQGNLNLIYGSTIESQATEPGMLSAIKFKILSPNSGFFEVKTISEVSVYSKEGNVLSVFPKLIIEPLGASREGQEVQYPDNLLLEKAFFSSSEPAIRDFKEILKPDPKMEQERVKPGFSMAFLKQLGTDIFISPIAALNEVLEEKTGGLLGK